MTITRDEADKLKELIEDRQEKAIRMVHAQDALWKAEVSLRTHINTLIEQTPVPAHPPATKWEDK